IAALETLLTSQLGENRTGLQNTIDFYKTADAVLSLEKATEGHRFETVRAQMLNPSTSDSAIVAMSKIANGSNGDQQETGRARETLLDFAKRNPAAAD